MAGSSSDSVKRKNLPGGNSSGQYIDSAANWQNRNPVLGAGQLGIESDTDRVKWGDGETAWNDLDYKLENEDAVISDPTGITGAGVISNIIALSQADYDNIEDPDENTLYVIVD